MSNVFVAVLAAETHTSPRVSGFSTRAGLSHFRGRSSLIALFCSVKLQRFPPTLLEKSSITVSFFRLTSDVGLASLLFGSTCTTQRLDGVDANRASSEERVACVWPSPCRTSPSAITLVCLSGRASTHLFFLATRDTPQCERLFRCSVAVLFAALRG